MPGRLVLAYFLWAVLAADEPQRVRDALLNLRDSKAGRDAIAALSYKGFVAPNPEVEGSTLVWLGL